MPDLLYRGARAALVLCIATIVNPVRAILTEPIGQGTITVRMLPWVTIPSGDGAPQDLTVANDGSDRLFISTRNGRVRVVNDTGYFTPGTLSGTTFLTMTNNPPNVSMFLNGEGGFSGLAFSPNYLTNGKFYTFTTETYNAANTVHFTHPEMLPNAGGITPANHIVIREWGVSGSPATALLAEANSSRVLMRINHPQNNHQGGSLKFGPDGMLYIGLGDGGGGDDHSGGTLSLDGHTNFNATTGLGGNGQDKDNVFGKILRINPDNTVNSAGAVSANGQYRIPGNNPFVNQAGLDEIYAYGLRNPYRMSFDSTTGKLYTGDVGQNDREEVDEIISGANYGWPIREGELANAPWTTPGGFTSIAPIAMYRNSAPGLGGGNSIIGGFVYRGQLMEELKGKYIFGDLDGGNSESTVGRIFYTDPAGGGAIFELKYDLTNGGASPASIGAELYSFGEDKNHELFALFSNGQVLRFVPEPGSASLLGLGLWLVSSRLVAKRQNTNRHQ